MLRADDAVFRQQPGMDGWDGFDDAGAIATKAGSWSRALVSRRPKLGNKKIRRIDAPNEAPNCVVAVGALHAVLPGQSAYPGPGTELPLWLGSILLHPGHAARLLSSRVPLSAGTA